MDSIADTLSAIRTAQARASAATTQAAAARVQGNAGRADVLIRQAQEDSERAQAMAQGAAAQATAVARGEFELANRPAGRRAFSVPWWGWAAAGLGGLWLVMRSRKPRKRGRR